MFYFLNNDVGFENLFNLQKQMYIEHFEFTFLYDGHGKKMKN